MSILLKISFLTALILGSLMAVINYSHYGLTQGVIAFVFFGFAGLVGGAILAKTIMYFNEQAISKLPFYDNWKHQGVNQQRNIVLPISYEQALEKGVRALSFVRGYRCYKKIDNKIVAKTRCSWKSCGERIELMLRPISASETEIQIMSRPRLFTTLIDYGKNCENIEIMLKILTEN